MIDWTVRHTICGLEELPGLRDAGITHALSLLDPEAPEPAGFAAPPPRERLTLRFHDVISAEPGLVVPGEAHVEALLAFGRTLPGADPAHLLVHCHMGVSRSTAAMAALLAQAHPEAAEQAILERIEAIRPQAWPNSRIVLLADAALGRSGRLAAALGRLYARQLARNPRFAEGLRSSGRGAEVEMAQG